MFGFETLFIVDEEELFEDLQLYKADENIFAAGCALAFDWFLALL